MSYKSKYRILLVDSNKDFIQAMKTQIKRVLNERIELIDTAMNGKDAIEMVRQIRYDVVFMDIDLPIMDGVTATKYLNRNFPTIKIVALSFYDDFPHIEEMILAGSHTYISKTEIDEDILKKIFSSI